MKTFFYLIFCCVLFNICIAAKILQNTSVRRYDFSRNAIPDSLSSGCQCQNDNCGCCETIEGVNLCVNMTYDPTIYGISLIMSYNGNVVFNESVSLRNPPPICVGMKELPIGSWCVVIYNVTWAEAKTGFCLKFEVKLLDKTLIKVPLGCYYFHRFTKKLKYFGIKLNKEEKNEFLLAKMAQRFPLKRINVIDLSFGAKDGTGCQCINDNCGCCALLQSTLLHINSSACVNMTYDKTSKNVSLVLTYNRKVLTNVTVNLVNPPPVCAGLPYFVTWCVDFTNITFNKTQTGACLNFELRAFGSTVFMTPVGCFYFPSNLIPLYEDNRIIQRASNGFNRRQNANVVINVV